MKTLNRSILNYKLRKMHHNPVTIASAPCGFGKTTALRSYLRNQDCHLVWFSMYEQQDEVWAWGKVILMLNKLLGETILSSSIPASRGAVDAVMNTLDEHLKKPLFLVLDDVTLRNIPRIMEVLSIYSYEALPSLHFVILTRDAMDGITRYHYAKRILLLNTMDFAFTKNEILRLCCLEQLPLSKEEIDGMYHYTYGWIMPILLMLESYKRRQDLYYQGDINTLIRRVFFDFLAPEVQDALMKLSVLKHFTLPFALKVCGCKQAIKKLIKLEKINYFIQTIDSQTYQFIPIFKDFLSKRLLISTIDVTELTKNIGNCYLDEGEPLAAIETFYSIRDYDSLMCILAQHPETSFSDIAPRLMIQVFKKLPDTYKQAYPFVYLKWITDCITNFPQMDGRTLLEDFKQRIDSGLINEDQQQLYGEYYFIHAFLRFNNVKKMMKDFKSAYHYFNGGYSKFAYPFMITSFGSSHMLFLYYNKLGAFKEITDYIAKNIHYFIQISNGIHSGTANLIKGEYLFEVGHYDQVLAHATLGYHEALSKNQLSGAICCLFLMGRLALMQGNHIEVTRVKEQLDHIYRTTNILILQNQIDCALAYLSILNDDYESVISWLKNGSLEDAYLLPEANITAYIAHGLCLAKEHNPIKLRTVSKIIREKSGTTTFVLAEIYANLFEVICNYEFGNLRTALKQFRYTLGVCARDEIQSPIIELSFAFEELIRVYTPHTQFEETLLLRVKKHLKAKTIPAACSRILTPKEKEILELFVEGKRAKDIASIKHISLNTVQTHLKSIYSKLNISSKVEAATYYNNHHKKTP